MSQGIFNNIDPTVTTGLMLAGLLDDFKVAICSGFSGSARPTNLQAGGMWVDTSLQAAPNYLWSLKIYTGTTDIEVFKISILSGTSGASGAKNSFTIRKVSADTVGAILNLVKNRIASGGQDLLNDTVAELRMTGRTNSSTDPIVAYMRVTAAEDMTTTDRGVALSLVSSPLTTGQLIEHLRFVDEAVETVAPHKINSKIFAVDSIATAASILATSDKILSELTGSTTSTVHGIEVGTGETRLKIIHNRSTADITLKHESVSASATERFKLPENDDLLLRPQGSACFFYCDTDSRWKYLFGSIANIRGFIYSFPDGYSEWVAPITGNVRVISFQEPSEEATATTAENAFSRCGMKTFLAWGNNSNGQLGVGDTTDRSVPTPVLGGVQLKFVDISSDHGVGQSEDGHTYVWGKNTHGELGFGLVGLDTTAPALTNFPPFTRVEIAESSYGQAYSGLLYAWGRNQFGQLGVGDVVPRSSPVAVLGGLKFAAVFHGTEGEGSCFGVERDTGLLYAWGKNDFGQLGVGDTAARSSPVAVLGGLKFRKVAVGFDSVVGLTESGVAYGWGANSDGELGVNNVTHRSSPVAVVGGLTFVDVFALPGADNSFYGLTDDGSLYAWGANFNGQLGEGSVASKSSPVAVIGGLKWERIARLNSDSRSVIALQLGTGSAYAWGENNAGQLGTNDVTPRSSPVAVVGGLKFSSIAMGSDFAYGSASDGRYYAWGSNTQGQLGDGTTVAKSSPVVIAAFTEPFFETPITKVVSVVEGTTYKIRAGGGASFFGLTNIGRNIRRVTVAYEN